MNKKELSPLKSFLSGRVFIISLIILVLPLFFHSIFMYHQDYKERQTDLFSSIDILRQMFTTKLQNKIEQQKQILKQIIKENDFSSDNFRKITSLTSGSFIFLLSYNAEDRLVCLSSSHDTEIGKVFSEKVYYEAVNEKYAYFIDGPSFCISKAIALHDGKEALLVASFSLDDFFDKNGADPYEFSLVDSSRKIFYSTDNNWQNKYLSSDKKQENIIYFTVDNKLENRYLLSFDNKDYCAVSGTIKDIHFTFFVSILQESLKALHLKSYLVHILSLIILVALGSSIAAFLIFKMAIPLKNLYQVMQKIKNYDFSVRYHKSRLGFEINIIGTIFNDMIDALIRHQKEVEKHLIEKQRLVQELRIGHKIQRSMFPSSLIKIPNMDVAYGYLPAKEVGGDFYDLLSKEDQDTLICVADAVGKGIPACLYSLSIRSMLRSSFVSGHDLVKTIVATNNLFYLDTKENSMFVTAWLGMYNKNSSILRYSSCGHPPALLKRGNEIIELKNDNIAFGVKLLDSAIVNEIKLEKGDMLLVYSDGVIEANNPSNELLGQQRLKTFLEQNSFSSSQEVVSKLLDEVKNFSKSVMQIDDITVVTIMLE
jgi:sigma-B regulation protein RsbU (phosphoserine phosphatase)